jgi:hypothetical protein
MRYTTKLALAGLAATVLLSFATGSVSARRIQVSEQGFLSRWPNFIVEASGNNVSCPATLVGSFHSKTLSKVSGQLIGYITTAQMPRGLEPPCRGGTVTVLTETMPWHVLYLGFLGTLPRIIAVRMEFIGMRVQVRTAGGTTCLAGTTLAHPAVADTAVETNEEVVTTLTFRPEFGIPLGGEFICGFAGEGHVSGTGEFFTLVFPQTKIMLRLVQ